MNDLDHIIIGVSDLARGVAHFESRTGVRPAIGGRHPGRGTENALLSLGVNCYLELIAPVPESEVAPELTFLPSLVDPTPIGFAAATSKLDETSDRLRAAGFPVSPSRDGARVTPDGQRLAWRSAALSEPISRLPPFLIAWSAESRHPSLSAPAGCTLATITFITPDVDRVRTLLALLGVAATVIDGPVAKMQATVHSPRGTLTLE